MEFLDMTTHLKKVSASSPVLPPAQILESIGDKIRQEHVTHGGTLAVHSFQGGSLGDVLTAYFFSSAGAFNNSYTLPANPTFPLLFHVPADAFALGSAQAIYWITNNSGNVVVAAPTLYTVVP